MCVPKIEKAPNWEPFWLYTFSSSIIYLHSSIIIYATNSLTTRHKKGSQLGALNLYIAKQLNEDYLIVFICVGTPLFASLIALITVS